MTAPRRTTTEADIARWLGINQKTLMRWREPRPDRPPVPSSSVNGRPFYDAAEVAAWMTAYNVTGVRNGADPPSRGVVPIGPATVPVPPAREPAQPTPPPQVVFRDAPIPPPDGGATYADVSARSVGAKADASVKVAKAKRAANDAKLRDGLADLGLDARIAQAKTGEDLFALSREVAGLVAVGRLPPDVASLVVKALHEARQALRAAARPAAATAWDSALIVGEEVVPLAELYSGIVNDDLRARALEAVRAIAEEDRASSPSTDSEAAA